MKKLLFFLPLMFSLTSRSVTAQELKLFDPGSEKIVNYEKYGTFEGKNTEKYKFKMTNKEALSTAVGEGIYPNSSVFKDPVYKELKAAKKLEGSQWNFVDTGDDALNFYKWATAAEAPGVKLFYTALSLERAGLLEHAVKAYYAILVNFPNAVGYTYWGTPWYIGPVAIDKIKAITESHPQFGMKLTGASVVVNNKFDNTLQNDTFIVNPGKIIKVSPDKVVDKPLDLKKLKKTQVAGTKDSTVKLFKFANDQWQLSVNDKPYVIKAICYSAAKVGLSPNNGTYNSSRDWSWDDYNKNGVIDGPYEAWVDANRNNIQDPDEKPVGDFTLMKEMGVNTLRIYHYEKMNKALLKDGYEKYGFRYLMGNMIGMYATGSKADWYTGTDYTDPVQIKNMLDDVRAMVEEYRDEPYVLMWVLGNENDYGFPGTPGVEAGTGCRASLQPEAYYSFVNQAALLVKELDPQKRPVAICNGDILFLDICAQKAPALDIFGANAYRGAEGFGALWSDVKRVFDRPVMVTEFGCSAYAMGWDEERAEKGQADYLVSNWKDIQNNLAGSGQGDALGGVLFEYSDEWWKANSDLPMKIQRQKAAWYAPLSAQYKSLNPAVHDTVPQFGAPFLDGWSYEEWLGVTGQGDGKNSPFMRQLRPAYSEYKKLWNEAK
jgi:hypothetical protein